MTRSRTTFENQQSTPATCIDDYHELAEEIDRLRKREKNVLRKTLSMEMELQNAKADRDLFRKKYLEARTKLEQISGNPCPVGTIEAIIPGDPSRVIVQILSGQKFICNLQQKEDVKIGDNVALHQRSMAILEVLPRITDPLIDQMKISRIPRETYADIGGLSEETWEVREVVEMSLTNLDSFLHFHISPPKGVLLHGAPGTGKTLIAKAVAHAAKAQFYYIAAPELVQKFIGEGARIVREIFQSAREAQEPSIIFIDEIDAVAAKRTNESQSGEREVNRTLMQILAEMDGFAENSLIRVIAATNRIDILDEAILRPGRFDRIIELPIPDFQARKEIIQIHIKDKPTFRIDLDDLVIRTDGMSGAEIQAVCQEAAILALRKRFQNAKRKNITHTDFLQAINKLKGKLSRKGYTLENHEESAKLYA